MLMHNKILLRSLESKDVNFLFALENDKSVCRVSGTKESFSKQEIRDYISYAREDIAIAHQYRFVIDLDAKPIGCIDLYDYDYMLFHKGDGSNNNVVKYTHPYYHYQQGGDGVNPFPTDYNDFDVENDFCLKNSPGLGFSIRNNEFLILDTYTSNFPFFRKK